MFSNKPNYVKLRTNLRLCINRLKLLEKKKTENALKARREISDYIVAGKEDRARIRVEHIIREDYLVEAMEIVELLCDLLLARFGLIEKMAELDPGIEEAIATIIWVTPRLSGDVQELREVSNQLTVKYGKEYAMMCLRNGFSNVNEKVVHRMSVAAPPKRLIENYMVEIAKSYNVPFEPDPLVMMDPPPEATSLIDLDKDFSGGTPMPSGGSSYQKHLEATGGDGGAANGPAEARGIDTVGKRSSLGGGGGAAAHNDSPSAYNSAGASSGKSPKVDNNGVGVGGYSPPFGGVPVLPKDPQYSSPGASGNSVSPQGASRNPPPPPLPSRPPNFFVDQQLPHYDDVMKSPDLFPPTGTGSVPTSNGVNSQNPFPAPRGGGPPGPNSTNSNLPGQSSNLVLPDVPGLPSVPTNNIGSTSVGGDDVDFDDLTRRFEELKRKK